MKLQHLHISGKLPIVSEQTRALATAWLIRTAIWSMLVFLFTINFSSMSALLSLPDHLSQMIIRHPLSPVTHGQTAAILWKQGLEEQAKEELALSQSLAAEDKSSILGAETMTDDLLNEWKTAPSRLNDTYRFWLRVIGEKPDYRDAYLQAAKNLLGLHNTAEALQLTNKALLLDPDYPPTTALLAEIEAELKQR